MLKGIQTTEDVANNNLMALNSLTKGQFTDLIKYAKCIGFF